MQLFGMWIAGILIGMGFTANYFKSKEKEETIDDYIIKPIGCCEDCPFFKENNTPACLNPFISPISQLNFAHWANTRMNNSPARNDVQYPHCPLYKYPLAFRAMDI